MNVMPCGSFKTGKMCKCCKRLSNDHISSTSPNRTLCSWAIGRRVNLWKTPDFRAAVRPDLFHIWSVPHFSEENALKDDWQLAYDIRRRTHTHDLVALCYTRKFGRIFLKDLTFRMKDPWLGETLSQLWPTYWSGGPAVQTKSVLYCPHC